MTKEQVIELAKQEPVALEDEMLDAAISWCDSNGINVLEPEQLSSLVNSLYITVCDAERASVALTAANAVSAEPQAQGEAPKWVDVQQRTEIAQAVYAAIRKEVPGLGPWSAFDADEAQRIVDAITHPQATEPAPTR